MFTSLSDGLIDIVAPNRLQ